MSLDDEIAEVEWLYDNGHVHGSDLFKLYCFVGKHRNIADRALTRVRKFKAHKLPGGEIEYLKEEWFVRELYCSRCGQIVETRLLEYLRRV